MSTLAEINKTLQAQTETLKSVNEALMAMLKEDREAREVAERDRVRQLEDKREAKKRAAGQRQAPQGFVGGLRAGFVEASGLGFLGGIGGWAEQLMGSVFGGSAAAGVIGAIARLVGRAGFWGPVALVISQFGESALTGLFDLIGVDDVIGDEAAGDFAASLANALKWGSIGLIFGRRMAAALAIGSLLSDAIRAVLPDNMSLDERLDLFGLELPITTDDFITYGSMIGAFFSASLIRSGIARLFTGNAAATAADIAAGRVPLLSRFARSFNAGMLLRRAGLGLAIQGIGELVASGVEALTGSQEAGDFINTVVDGISMGYMFGPHGAIIGGVLGFALAGAQLTANWLDNRRNQLHTELMADLAAADDDLEAALAANDMRLAEQAYQHQYRIVSGMGRDLPGFDAAYQLLEQRLEDIAALDPHLADQLETEIGHLRAPAAASPTEAAELVVQSEYARYRDAIQRLTESRGLDLQDRNAVEYFVGQAASSVSGFAYLDDAEQSALITRLVNDIMSQDLREGATWRALGEGAYQSSFSAQALPRSRGDAESLEDLVAYLSTHASGGGTAAPVIINNDNSSPSYNSSHIRYDQNILPYDMQDYMRRGLIPPAIGAYY